MSIIIMLLLISLLILVHELGHFSVARFFDVKVDRFGFGLPFGPVLWEKKIGDVTYCVHAFLLGGYVSFPEDDPDCDLPEDDPQRLMNKPIWQRACVISAGVIANAILAFIIIIGVVVFGKGLPTGLENVSVKELSDKVPIATEAGLKPGDQIYGIEGKKIKNFRDFRLMVLYNKAFDGFVYPNDQRKQLVNIVENNKKLFKKFGYNPENLSHKNINIIENTVIPDNYVVNVPKAAYETNTIPDLTDQFIVLKPIKYGEELSREEKQYKQSIRKNKFVGNGEMTFGELAKISADTYHEVVLTVKRDGKEVNVDITPNKDGILGFVAERDEIFEKPESSVAVITGSGTYLYDQTALLVTGLAKILTGQVSLWDLHGIVAITKFGGDVIEKRGMTDAWLLTALISIDLAIVNLLPIPALDGGHLLFLLIEKVRGRPVDEEAFEAATKYGFLFLIGLMIFIIFNDIRGIVIGKF